MIEYSALERVYQLLKEKGIRDSEIYTMSDEQLRAMLPELGPKVDQDARNRDIVAVVEEWKKQNPGRTPDYFVDVVPILNRRMVSNAKQGSH